MSARLLNNLSPSNIPPHSMSGRPRSASNADSSPESEDDSDEDDEDEDEDGGVKSRGILNGSIVEGLNPSRDNANTSSNQGSRSSSPTFGSSAQPPRGGRGADEEKVNGTVGGKGEEQAWKRFYDETSSTHYWFNDLTGESSWLRPKSLSLPSSIPIAGKEEIVSKTSAPRDDISDDSDEEMTGGRVGDPHEL